MATSQGWKGCEEMTEEETKKGVTVGSVSIHHVLFAIMQPCHSFSLCRRFRCIVIALQAVTISDRHIDCAMMT